MSVIQHLASSLNKKGEEANIILADRVAKSGNTIAIKELVVHLTDKDKGIRHDSIKVLYEIGERKPALIKEYYMVFIDLLKSKDNRMQWGAMTALNAITTEMPDQLYTAIPALAVAVDAGSVITRDNYISILLKLYSLKSYSENVFPLLMEQFSGCPSNQLPMYAENMLPLVNDKHKKLLVNILTQRLGDFEKETKQKRVEKLIKKLQAS